MMPTISVLSPSFNYLQYLPQALDSVSSQADGSIEHVVVDDTSPDPGVDQLLSQRSSNLVYRRHDVNRGLSATLNHAVSIARGEWIGWLNTDDFYLPGALNAVQRAVRGRPDVDVVYGDSIFVDEDSRMLRLAPEHPFSRSVLRRYGPFIAPCALFIRRSRLPLRGWDEATVKLMDWDLYLQLMNDGARFLHIARPLGAFRRHEAQTSKSKTPHEEKQLIRRRFDLVTDARMIETVGRVGWLQHGAMKAANGAYLRQLRAREFAGFDMAWFRSPASERVVRRMIATCSDRHWRAAEGGSATVV